MGKSMFTFNLSVWWPCGNDIAIDFVEMGKQFVILIAKLVKNAITILGPLMGKDFGRITKDFLADIPIGEKMVRKGNVVSLEAAASTLLGKWTTSVNWVVWTHMNVSILEKNSSCILGLSIWLPTPFVSL